MSIANHSIDQPFLDALRYALNHLYDPELLRHSPLTRLWSDAGQVQAANKLQHALLEGIQSLRPSPAEPPASAKRRLHQVLQLRYEQQFTQQEVATQLGLSVRQYRRLQQSAVESLALQIVEELAPNRTAAAPAPPAAPGLPPESLPESLQWVQALSPAETTKVSEALPDLLRLVQPLAERKNKQIELRSEPSGEDDAAAAVIHPLVLRQALLHLLNAAILHTSADKITVTVAADRKQVAVTVRAVGECTPGSSRQPAAPGVEVKMIRQMLQTCNATLALDDSHGWQARLLCERAEQQPVIVIDDHLETIDLLQRYTTGTRYRIVACSESRQALACIRQQEPLLVLLDVMMPVVDGWEVLTHLKQDEATAAIPVWVCTVLDQSELALSLGADGFLRKPITRQALLAVLDAQTGDQAPARR